MVVNLQSIFMGHDIWPKRKIYNFDPFLVFPMLHTHTHTYFIKTKDSLVAASNIKARFLMHKIGKDLLLQGLLKSNSSCQLIFIHLQNKIQYKILV